MEICERRSLVDMAPGAQCAYRSLGFDVFEKDGEEQMLRVEPAKLSLFKLPCVVDSAITRRRTKYDVTKMRIVKRQKSKKSPLYPSINLPQYTLQPFLSISSVRQSPLPARASRDGTRFLPTSNPSPQIRLTLKQRIRRPRRRSIILSQSFSQLSPPLTTYCAG